jgi:protein-disulfide isomerase
MYIKRKLLSKCKVAVKPEEHQKKHFMYVVKLLGIIILLLIFALILLAVANLQLESLKGDVRNLQLRTAGGDSAGGNSIRASIDDDAILGNVDAKVTIVEFSDFECPYCGKFYQETFPDIKKNYIDKGLVRFVHRDFPLSMHAHAEEAAEAAECAGEQGFYFPYAHLLYGHQELLETKNLLRYAKDLGLNETAFNDCLSSGAMKEEVQKDMNEGISYGVKGTPAFFINGEFISGNRPYSVYDDAIKKGLASS